MDDNFTTEATGTDIAVMPAREDIPALFSTAGKIEALVADIEKDVQAEVLDVTTPVGRKRIGTLARKVSGAKTTIDGIGKDLNEERNRQNKAVNVQRNLVTERLDALRDQVKAPLKAWEDAEANRVQAHMVAIDAFDQGRVDGHSTSKVINSVIAEINAIEISDAWEEYEADARAAKAAALDKWAGDLEVAVSREAAEAELAELREKAAARDAEDAERAKREEEAEAQRYKEKQIEADAKAAEIQAAEDKARAQAHAEAEAKATEERHTRELAEAQAETERAAQAERDRIAQEAANEEAAANERAADKKHRRKIRDEITKAIAALKPANVEEIVDAMMAKEIPHVQVNL